MGALTQHSDVLIMAGGRSQRMRRSAGAAHKALVPILGVPMIERNVRYVIESGFRNVVVAVSAHETELAAYLRGGGADLARRLGGRCEILIEDRPLGTIGAVREVPFDDALLVVNVDNLTVLSLAALIQHHRREAAAMTIAAHREPLPFDFGELKVAEGRIVAYLEKPVRYPLTSSGTYVVSRAAAECIEVNESIGVPALFERLNRRGLPVVAFEHDGLWIDVNDRVSVERAEVLLSARDGPVQ